RGLRVRENRLYVQPRLPGRWHGYQADWRLEGKLLHIRVSRGAMESVTVNGAPAGQGMSLDTLPEESEIVVVVMSSH
ncbi:MAG: hypothetical protein LUF68_08170, partial [Clostridiales bacterium]|nr:hypothetical protein [Clostridiales bacterium]